MTDGNVGLHVCSGWAAMTAWFVTVGLVLAACVTVGPRPRSSATGSLPGTHALATILLVDGRWNVYLLLDGKQPIRLTESGTVDGGADLSPDGRRVVFSDSRRGTEDLYVMDVDANGASSGLRRLTSALGKEAAPRWSPDGSTIAFQHVFETSSFIETIRSDGQALTRLTDDGRSWNPSWSPDSTHIIFCRTEQLGGGQNYDLWRMNANGTHPRRLLDTGGNDGRPLWSPDGNAIAFTSDLSNGFKHVWVARPDGSGAHPLTTCSCREDVYGWSSDSKYVFFVSTRDDPQGSGALYYVPVTGGEPHVSVAL